MSQPDAFDAPARLLGLWLLQRAEPGLDLMAGTRMEFRGEGELVYVIVHEDQEAQFSLRYRIAGDTLHTEHVHGDHRASAAFQIHPEGLLELNFSGRRAWFRREHVM